MVPGKLQSDSSSKEGKEKEAVDIEAELLKPPVAVLAVLASSRAFSGLLPTTSNSGAMGSHLSHPWPTLEPTASHRASPLPPHLLGVEAPGGVEHDRRNGVLLRARANP